ncbi:hypothetical protein KO561_09175 [Radiobacillus kanasensis]|uniref:hypothetical protein n=1 Tax=Radiobacillus kanasensis TaxID=2844358 RepID=UPI001E5A5FB8|nr:hypothetical protein [Radiobacillus kanasensis]UFU01086.1 hypothetical protein KO561_09175 [Radiobacillus kanasensis]
MKEQRMFWFSVAVCLTLFIVIGFSSQILPANSSDSLAIISAKPNSDYNQTFEELGMGVVYDFQMTLPQADETWVKIWVDAYQSGKEIQSNPVGVLSYGLSPNEYEEGHIGLALVEEEGGNPLLVLYAPGVKTLPSQLSIPLDIVAGGNITDYAIGMEDIHLTEGETKLLAVHRTVKDSAHLMDWNDATARQTMIQESETALLLKIKVAKEMPETK